MRFVLSRVMTETRDDSHQEVVVTCLGNSRGPWSPVRRKVFATACSEETGCPPESLLGTVERPGILCPFVWVSPVSAECIFLSAGRFRCVARLMAHHQNTGRGAFTIVS